MITFTWDEETEQIEWLDKDSERTESTTAIVNTESTKYNIVKRNSKENKLSKELESVGATDSFLAQGLYSIAKNAQRAINTKDNWIIEVPDYWVQLKALTTISKIKWHLNNVWEAIDDFDWDVIFID